MRTFFALTTENASLLGWRIVAAGSTRRDVEHAERDLTLSETERRNFCVLSASAARRCGYVNDHTVDQFLADDAAA